MVAQIASQAVANANAYVSCIPGLCLKYTRTWLMIDSRYQSAAVSWYEADRQHAGDRNPPTGAPVFWTGGSKGYGHIALSVGNGKIRSTDIPSGKVATVDLDYVERFWGQKYMGWSEDLNGVLIPYLAMPTGGDSQWQSGPVWVEKLVYEQTDSDSVARLRYRLRHHRAIPPGRQPKQGRVYNESTLVSVRYWQRNVAGDAPGPKDGQYLSNQQANRLFGPAYDIHPKD